MAEGTKGKKSKEIAVIEIAGIVFDSQKGELSLGDMEELEHKGVDLTKMSTGDSISVIKTRIVAQICLHKANPDAGVNDEFMAAIPASKIGELGGFVSDFFGKSFPGEKGRQ